VQKYPQVADIVLEDSKTSMNSLSLLRLRWKSI